MNAQHTPTPWTHSGRYIFDTKGNRITTACLGMDLNERDANVAHIVKCVNAHDALVAALQLVSYRISEGSGTASFTADEHDAIGNLVLAATHGTNEFTEWNRSVLAAAGETP